MRAEKVVLSFIALLLGLLAAGVVFYFYQSTKVVSPSKLKQITIKSTSPTPEPSIYLSIDSPKDESVLDKKTVTISGTTTPDAVIVVSTYSSDQVVSPAQNGNFSISQSLQDGQNLIEITAIAPNGEEAKVTKTVTFSTENF